MRARGLVFVALGAALAVAVACGSGAPPAGGSNGLPNALAGPFRVLRKPTEGASAPFVVGGSVSYRDPSALDLDGNPDTLGVAIYLEAGENGFPHTIYRYDLPDGPARAAKAGSGTKVLSADQPWEGKTLARPFVLRVGGEIWLYYEAAGCIGRAVSSDGLVFSKPQASPVLCGDPASWETGAVGAPSVHVAHDGSFRLLYGAGGAIGEARSSDGIAFTRVSTSPVLTARAPLVAEVVDGGSDDPFDDATVDDPDSMISATSDGKPLTYLYYTGTNRLGQHVIGLAARFGDDGPFDANPQPVLSRYDAHGPSVVRNGALSMLYVGGRSNEASMTWTPSILAGVAPATGGLPSLPDAGTDAAP
jgi:hypothetical protein